MFGFQVVMGGGKTPADIVYNDIRCRNYMIDKFKDDKVFNEDESLITILDGVILNKKSLMEKYRCDSWSTLVTDLYEKNGETFFDEFRGSFAGAVYDKGADKWVIYGDQLGTKYVYYAKVGDFFACSEVMGNMYSILKENHIQYHQNINAAYMLLSYGFMLEDNTLCSEVKKIQPGCYITLTNGIIEEKTYYTLDNPYDYAITETEAIERIDFLFRQAVKRQFDKDIEYGYEHVCALSGGLDCRMTSFVAHDLGYTKQLNVTFSQSDYWDETEPKKMARDLKHDWLFKALDNGNWLADIDEVTKVTGGNVTYYGTAHGNSLFRLMNWSRFGLLHSGQMGDEVINTNYNRDKSFSFGQGAICNSLLDKISHTVRQYNEEIGMWYYRYLNGTNNGQQNEYNYTETFSPFTDIDFLSYCLTIPYEIRKGHNIYIKWILSKYPAAAKYVWEKIRHRIDEKKWMIHGHTIYKSDLKCLPQKCWNHIFPKPIGVDSAKNMNPYGYYMATNKDLSDYINSYLCYSDKIEDCQLRADVIESFNSNNAAQKIQALSYLAALKIFY